MTFRVTLAHVESKVAQANKILLGDPNPQYPTPGQIVLDRAYGGTSVHLVVNAQGGQRDLSQCGYGTLREANDFLRGLLTGLDTDRLKP